VDTRGSLFGGGKFVTSELRNQLPGIRSLTQPSPHNKYSSTVSVLIMRSSPKALLSMLQFSQIFFSWLKRNLMQILLSLRSAVSQDCNDRNTHSAQTLLDISGTETQLSVTWILTTLIYSK